MNLSALHSALVNLHQNKLFEWFVISIIVFSALIIGAKTFTIISPNVLEVIRWLDLMITLIFLVEILIRFVTEPQKLRFFTKGWNIFDTAITHR